MGYESVHPWGDLHAPIELNLGGKQSWQKRFKTSDPAKAEAEAKAQVRSQNLYRHWYCATQAFIEVQVVSGLLDWEIGR